MFSKIYDIFESYTFEIVLLLCVLFLVILAIYRKITGQKGTYSKYNYLIVPSNKKRMNKLRFRHVKVDKKPKKKSTGERECKKVLEELFGKKFTSQRPDFLRNPVTGNKFNLELDCYNEELKLAIEYNGVQHYKHIPFFHKNKEQFYNQKYRDDMKRRICEEQGLTLIEVPYKVKLKDIKDYIKNKCVQAGYKL